MMKKIIFTAVSAVMLSMAFAGSAWSDPDGSQNLRGLGGRSFAVTVTDLTSGGPPFENCYTFNADGSWDDPEFLPGFPVPGIWTQDSVGAATSYTATAFAPLGGGVAALLTQVGTVTPAKGRGTLQLDADNTVEIVLEADPSVVIMHLANLTSVGAEVESCPL